MARRRRVIFHIDVNSAFLSWTAVQLMQSGHQDIRLVPSVVSEDPSDRRSIITATSIPVKKIGIKTAEPITMALRKHPDGRPAGTGDTVHQGSFISLGTWGTPCRLSRKHGLQDTN